MQSVAEGCFAGMDYDVRVGGDFGPLVEGLEYKTAVALDATLVLDDGEMAVVLLSGECTADVDGDRIPMPSCGNVLRFNGPASLEPAGMACVILLFSPRAIETHSTAPVHS